MTATRERIRTPLGCVALTAAIAGALGCATTPDNQLYRPESARFERALVLPMNVVMSLPNELADSAERLDHELHAYLTARGKKIETVDLPDARGAWLASTQECKSRAQQGCRGFDGAAGVLAERLRDGRDYELVIIPNLISRAIKTSARNACWDGVCRELEVRPAHGAIQLDQMTVQAPSLSVFAFSRDGDKVFEGVGGLDLAHRLQLVGSSIVAFGGMLVPREDLFTDSALVREGIAIALHPLVPEDDESAK